MARPIVKAVLLAAGLGTRLRPLTETTPKCLVPIAGRPLLEYWIDAIALAGIRDVLINTHHLRGDVRAYCDRINQAGRVNVTEAYEPELLGSAGTIAANRGWADDADECIIIYADNLSNVALGDLLCFHRSHDAPLTIMLFHAMNPTQCGIVEVDETGTVVDFVEKPPKPRSDLANAGVYVADANTYRDIADMHCCDLGHEVLPAFVGRARGWTWNGYHRDIGTYEALSQAEVDATAIFGPMKAAL